MPGHYLGVDIGSLYTKFIVLKASNEVCIKRPLRL